MKTRRLNLVVNVGLGVVGVLAVGWVVWWAASAPPGGGAVGGAGGGAGGGGGGGGGGKRVGDGGVGVEARGTRVVGRLVGEEARWQEELQAAYLPMGDAAIKRVQAPFPAARESYWKSLGVARTEGPNAIMFEEEAGQLSVRSSYYGSSVTLEGALVSMVGLKSYEFESKNPEWLWKSLPGDWVVRKGSERRDKLADLAREFGTITGTKAEFVKYEANVEVVVVSGRAGGGTAGRGEFVSGANLTPLELEVPEKNMRPTTGGFGGPVTFLLERISKSMDVPVVDEMDKSAPGLGPLFQMQIKQVKGMTVDGVMRQLEEKLGVKTKKEIRPLAVYVLEGR